VQLFLLFVLSRMDYNSRLHTRLAGVWLDRRYIGATMPMPQAACLQHNMINYYYYGNAVIGSVNIDNNGLSLKS